MRPGLDIPLSKGLRYRPKDGRGYPIPFLVLYVEGKPDFRAIDTLKWKKCIEDKLCALCGRPLKKGYWFVGGPKCEQNRFFFDPAMHEDCARYALKVCPHLAISQSQRSKLPLPYEGSKLVDEQKSAYFMLGLTGNYQLVLLGGQPIIKAGTWSYLEHWKDGEQIAQFRNYSNYLTA